MQTETGRQHSDKSKTNEFQDMDMDEEEVWKCTAHPSKRRHPYSVCPRCLRDKLSSLCPDCASLLPCSCSSSDSSASSSSSLFSRFFSSRSSSTAPDRSLTRKVTHLMDSEPSFRRSRSVATINLPSFLRSRSKFLGRDANPAATPPPPMTATAKTALSFWEKFRRDWSKRGGFGGSGDEDMRTMMRKSRSVAVGYNKNHWPESGKGRGWSRYFPSPTKAFGGHGSLSL